MIRSFIFDVWSRLTRGERLDVVAEPVTPPCEVLEAAEGEAAGHADVDGCRCSVCKLRRAIEDALVAAPEPIRVRVPFGYLAPVHATAFAATGEAVVAAEDRVLARLARETSRGGVSPWDAAVHVFGGAAVAREASREGLSATLAGEPAESVHG